MFTELISVNFTLTYVPNNMAFFITKSFQGVSLSFWIWKLICMSVFMAHAWKNFTPANSADHLATI